MERPEHGVWRERQVRARSLIARETPTTSEAVGPVALLSVLCRSLVKNLAVTGAAVQLMSEAGSQGVLAYSDERTSALVELEFTLGDGPSREAFAARRPVLIPDLRAGRNDRWPGYLAESVAAGVGAVFAFPLNVGAAGFGVLDVLCDEAGPLSEDDLGMILTFAQIATEILLDGRLTTYDGHLDPELAAALDPRSEIHQAQGMLMVILDVSLAEALVRMRAHAFSRGRPLIELAREIIDGRFSAEDGL